MDLRRAFGQGFQEAQMKESVMGLLRAIEENKGALVEIFKDLHAHPEIGFTETCTAGIVADQLRQ